MNAEMTAADLAAETCVPCHGESAPVTAEEITDLAPLIPEWDLLDRDGVPRLKRTFRFRDYRSTLAFTQRVGELAEAQDHHPAILTEWGRVTVTWWTFRIRNLHRNDFVMAAKTDRLFAEFAGGR